MTDRKAGACMNELEYATAVARIRVHETRLLGADKIEQLIAAESYRDALKRLGDLGYDVQSGDASVILKTEQQNAWQLLCEIAPDKSELEFLTVRNSFLNLKAALKCVVSGLEADAYFCAPANVPDETIVSAATTRDFSLLPEYMQDVAERAYTILTTTGDGQHADVIIDKKSLETYLDFAARLRDESLTKLAQFTVAAADMKIAYRCAKTANDAAFLDDALVACDEVDCGELKTAALAGEEEVIDCIARLGYSEAAELLRTSPAAFEKWCDDFVLSTVQGAKYEAFGFLPLAGYYIAKENEIKTLRIVLAAKENELPAEMIRERVRMLYV